MQKMYPAICQATKSLFLLVAFAVIVVCGVPQQAFAVNIPTDACDPAANGGKDFVQEAMNIGTNTALQKAQAEKQVMSSMGYIDAYAAYCFGPLVAVYDWVTGLGSGNPFNPYTFILGILISQVANLVVTVLSAVCQYVLNDLRQLSSFLLSQLNRLCIPLPNLNLGLGGGLGLKNVPPCNGLSLNPFTPYGVQPRGYRDFFHVSP
jgi:hypothetical protein